MAVLREDGFHALTQTRVAERSGLRQSHLTYYFPRRADLLMAVAETVASQMQARVSVQSNGRPLDIDGLRAVLHAQLADRELPRLMLALVAAADEDARLGAWLVRFHAGIAAMLAAATPTGAGRGRGASRCAGGIPGDPGGSAGRWSDDRGAAG